MPDAIPDTSPMPYLIGVTDSARYAYFGNGAIRQMSATEYVELKGLVRVTTLKAADVAHAEKVSQTLFGV